MTHLGPGESRPARAAVSASDRLLAEAARALEDSQQTAEAIDDRAAVSSAIDGGGDLEHRIVIRARHLPVAGALRRGLDTITRASAWLVVLAFVLAIVLGAAAARGALGGERESTVNVFWLLGGILGGQTLLLIAWIVLLLASPGALRAGSLGGLVVAAARGVARRAGAGREAAAAAIAFGRRAIGPARLGAISHGWWVAFNAGCLVMVLALLSARQYDFGWETTILSDDAYASITATLGRVPGLVFETPDAEQIAAARLDPANEADGGLPGDEAGARRAWSGLLVGAIVFYGLLPRLVLTIICAAVAGRSGRRPLDLDAPGFARLRPRLMPAASRLGVVDPDDTPGLDAPIAPTAPAANGREAGPPALLGLEIAPPACGWPPPVAGIVIDDLGLVESGDDRRAALDAVTAGTSAPAAIVAVAALTSTPDRGLGRFLADLRAAVSGRVILVLTAGEAMRRRSDADGVRRRVDDWRGLARRAGLSEPDVVELDLDHLTETTRRAFMALLGGDAARATARPRRIDSAFALIEERASGWSSSPSGADQAELHRAIVRHYDTEATGMPRWLAAPKLDGDLVGSLRDGADRVVGMLPPSLRLRPRWLAAGAVAGALGCVAAATFAAPVAIASLPMWSGIGAAIGQFVAPTRGASDGDDQGDDSSGFDAAVRSAALLAMLLELQGEPEATIADVLDRATADLDDSAPITSAAEAAAFLGELRHRFDTARAALGGNA